MSTGVRDIHLAVDSGHRTLIFPDDDENPINSRDTLERLALVSPADHEELARLTSISPFLACKVFNISNATSDEITFMAWLPKLGLPETILTARDFGWKYERALENLLSQLLKRERLPLRQVVQSHIEQLRLQVATVKAPAELA
jgi:hypothetical protein